MNLVEQPVKRPDFKPQFHLDSGPELQCSKGVTLPELLIATAITSIVIAVAFSGLLIIIDADNKAEEQVDRRGELNRALDFIATDIREATSISYTPPLDWKDEASSPYQPVFYLLKPPDAGGAQRAVGYYVRDANDVVWQGPRVVYRLEPSNGDPTATADDDLSNKIFQDVGTKGSALVDAVVAQSPTCSDLPGTPSTGLPDVGLKVFISNEQTAKVCLAGEVDKADNLSLETQVFARGRP